MARRIYLVTETGNAGRKPRLVRAHNQAQAIRHAARNFTAKVADQEELLSARDMGVPVETAGDEAEDGAGAGAGAAEKPAPAETQNAGEGPPQAFDPWPTNQRA